MCGRAALEGLCLSSPPPPAVWRVSGPAAKKGRHNAFVTENQKNDTNRTVATFYVARDVLVRCWCVCTRSVRIAHSAALETSQPTACSTGKGSR